MPLRLIAGGGAALTPSDFVTNGNCGVIPKKAIESGGKLALGTDRTYCTDSFFSANRGNQIDNSYLVTTLRDLVPSGPTIGFIVEFDEPGRFILAQGVYGFQTDRQKLLPPFLAALSNKQSYRRTMQRIMVGSTQVHIRNGDFFGLRFRIPTLPEQQKISDFLGTVDARVRLLRRRQNALRAYKKGMMQRLFSQERRFTKPDGSPFPDWQERRLGEIASEKFANGVFNDPQLVGTGYRLINVKDMFGGNQIALHSLHLVAIDEREFLKNRAEKGDIFFTRSSLVKEGIAYSNVLLEDAEDVTFDGHLIRLRPDQRVCIPRFLAAQLRHGSLRRQLVARGKTGTMTTIGQEDVSTVRVALPHPEEQQKIADTLTALDTKIDAVTAQIDAMLRFKKGLLQQMFV